MLRHVIVHREAFVLHNGTLTQLLGSAVISFLWSIRAAHVPPERRANVPVDRRSPRVH